MDTAAISAAVDRLAAEFARRVPPRLIAMIVTGCIEDLSGIPRAALPELCERAARQRVIAYLAASSEQDRGNTPFVDAAPSHQLT